MTSQFSYNPAGQIVSKTQSNDAAYTWLPSPANQTISSPADNQNKLATFQSASVASDGNADVVSGINALTYLYDVLGQLRKATNSSGSVTVDYDPSGTLQKETNGGTVTEYLYDGPDLIAEYVNGALAHRFVHGARDDEPLVWFQGSGTSSPSFLHADERGSIIAASNGSGVVTASAKYGSYGESGALVSPFGYTGQLYMPDLQLYYYKARMYSAQTGRFLQPDPIGYGAGMNLYAYAGADPANLGDPSGLDPDPCGAPYGGVQATICVPHPRGIPVNGVSPPAPRPPNVDGGGNGDGNNSTSHPPQEKPCTSGLTAVSPNNAGTLITDSQGNEVMGVNPDGSVTPMSGPVGRPPIWYAATGQLSQPNALRLPMLMMFAPGFPLDAQRYGGIYGFGSSFNGFVAYANYSFGIFSAASGLPLSEALSGANAVASFAHYNPAWQTDTTGQYPHLLDSNVQNITNGYNAYKSGAVCKP